MNAPVVKHAVGHSTNLVGVPTEWLASVGYNASPSPLHIAGTRETNRSFFAQLARATDARQAAALFTGYMDVLFGLCADNTAQHPTRPLRVGYAQVLQGWGFRTNGTAGATLKGWVESRFGIFPTFHRAPMTRPDSALWAEYDAEKFAHRYFGNSLWLQFDLLYEYAQQVLPQWIAGGRTHLTLYRGVNDFAEQRLLRHASDGAVVRLNNLVSFSTDKDIAGGFGDYVLEAHVPLSKIFFGNVILPQHPLQGESEYLVIGGDYRVTVAYA